MDKAKRQKKKESHEEHQLFVSPKRRMRFNPSTSTPILERRSLQNPNDSSGYKKWCREFERSCASNAVLSNEASISFCDKSGFYDHLLSHDDTDLLNQPIIEDEIKDTLKERIFNLFNGSYKTFIQKTSSIIKKKKKKHSNREVE